MTVPRYPSFKAGRGDCPDCLPGIACVACRFAGRPAPPVRRYPGRLMDAQFVSIRDCIEVGRSPMDPYDLERGEETSE